MKRELSDFEILMHRKVISDWKNVSEKEMFLYLLQNRTLHFFDVCEDDVIPLIRHCIKLGLLRYRQSKEYLGTVAEFDVLKSFNIQWGFEGYRRSHLVYVMEKGNGLILTEHFGCAEKNGNNWFVEIDIPTGKDRFKFYERTSRMLTGGSVDE